MRLRDILLTSVCSLALAVPAMAQTTYTAVLTGASEVGPVVTQATGNATVVLNAAQTQISISCQFQNLTGTYSASHIHGPAPVGVNASVKWGFLPPTAPWVFSNANHDGTLSNFVVAGITATDVSNLNAGLMYVNVHSSSSPGGEIRGQLGSQPTPTTSTTWGRVKRLFR